MLYKKSNLQQKKEVSDMLSVLPAEIEAIRASQSEILEKEGNIEKEKETKCYCYQFRGGPQDEDDDKKNKEETKSETKEEDVKLEIKDEGMPSVVLDKKKGLDVHVLAIAGNMIDFQSLQGLINIHFHFHNK